MSNAKKHKHHFVVSYWSGRSVSYLCRCGASKNRNTTSDEEKEIKRRMLTSLDLPDNHPDNIHRVWHDFSRRFAKFKKISFEGKSMRHPERTKTYTHRVADGWKYTGWELIVAIEKWAKKYPDDVFQATVDDSSYMGSRLFFIVHRNRISYHGTTVFYAPQDGQGAGYFFMYPGHRASVEEALQRVLDTQNHMARVAREWRKKHPVNRRQPWLTEMP